MHQKEGLIWNILEISYCSYFCPTVSSDPTVDKIKSLPSKDLYILIPKTYKYITLHSISLCKRDRVMNLKMKKLSQIIQVGPIQGKGPTRVLVRGEKKEQKSQYKRRKRDRNKKRKCETEAEAEAMQPQVKGRSSCWKLEKQQTDQPIVAMQGTQLCQHIDFSSLKSIFYF